MNEIHLKDIDLNLLIALDTLLSVEEVGTAAARMGVTQSAMSHALRRLRQQFGDPLLVKGKGRMVKTAKAEALAKPLRRALLELQHALVVDATFAPKTSSRRMTIATNDYGDLILLPELIRLISRQAPGVGVRVAHFDPETSFAPIEAGEIELAICHPLEQASGIHQQVLFEDDFCCAVRRDHPLIGDVIDLPAYLALSHLAIAPRGLPRDPIERALTRLGEKRRITLCLPNLNTAPMIVATSDLILTAPRRCILAWQNVIPIRQLEAPFDVPPFAMAMIWHERFQRDPAHRWLREKLRGFCESR
ncbi:MAG: LysR family transcriptional regulator [Rhodocyclaceae bacterium]|jgi:DNA-binding transcriptional LysR family regulator|nr:LysR family transcriptional regulator [Rhodocyclaceae bacterium]MBK6554840.1 LysR family transcriptional regulator [Rhodocyclaceae bacterium]MBK6677201.1 LysR family transcriptional regulator [Rhodocyclaceae bacterium]MBK9309881.1 LysR family transcriptional regulator [Rhodocyclaceae bacterium]MBK9953633.1 LysR family transcriptional regulator [Rhodocyclaceae bacterium]